jgi:formylglycine-generating enzyme required for sulfatase activity
MLMKCNRKASLGLLCALVAFAYGGWAQSAQRAASAAALGMDFVSIPAGEFMMGCSTGDERCEPDERPRHRVRITRPFEIGKYEVTQAQWLALMGANPSSNKGDSLPVETVSKLEALEFIAKLNAAGDGYVYRLPTEAEWEYAARAGDASPYSGPLGEVAWYAANSEDETHPVGRKKPNAWGLYDVQGNVREWVWDLYSPTYYGVSPIDDPSGPEPASLVTQGPGGPRGGRGGRGGPAFQGPLPPEPPPVPLPPGATLQQQVDALRQQVERLQQELRQLRAAVNAGVPPQPAQPPQPPPGPLRGGGPLGPPFQGPAVEVRPGVLIDPLDGLPTGLPVVRGGGWDQSAGFQRVSARYSYYGPTLRVSDIGFRVVRSVPSSR